MSAFSSGAVPSWLGWAGLGWAGPAWAGPGHGERRSSLDYLAHGGVSSWPHKLDGRRRVGSRVEGVFGHRKKRSKTPGFSRMFDN